MFDVFYAKSKAKITVVFVDLIRRGFTLSALQLTSSSDHSRNQLTTRSAYVAVRKIQHFLLYIISLHY